ncbi:bifunctional phosphopantothenoylcysteine decarboxylase/phosphopantothenate--cysteine ligase CoaBC [Polynucleobacter sp. MWH-Spelu-300-X4]|uniref:bifunctional phosphopantothenoylcysteine decarboxylase/phosphopantothenate--cysteine ligase CoaBC n=1 Tax=Polynucleobacter sp. MWH-Spelu-300-X4 TaxID=2689109 RepID=UPI001BFDE955|nr:bifunctional phosphopantothenoylcysteine decarboxylase/phosphopantothenate--cysteine ligase CoaBC [Polynucleobacter sp. MWH-Spelu-300-X4]QWD79496.1 bifunctional phosphopantothenoylcysteine decarboxylase/phosphopantothenate--cysteine ligase CoaBC [Polynucleobacter sp. MWH-Spelu-300-X4]
MNSLQGKHILLAMSGGIAAFKVAELARLLIQDGASVQVAMSEAATQFMTPVTMQALTGQPVYTNQWDARIPNNMAHIELSRKADLILVAPASADMMAKISLGLADDLISVLCLARECPLIVVPAMNKQMWENAATQENIQKLKSNGVGILGPTSGTQACGENGMGRMLEAKEIFEGVVAFFQPKLLTGKKVLITAGPTYEAIDPVRGITNKSSGKMGFAIAQAAIESGAKVTLIAGPCHLDTPLEFTGSVNRINVTSAQEMSDAVMQELDADIFFAVAAVADWTVENAATQKIKKDGSNQASPELNFKLNPDILAEVSKKSQASQKPFCVGFAAETNDLESHAKEKRVKKNIPLLVANLGPSTFGLDDNELLLVEESGTSKMPRANKLTLARQLINHISKKI